MKQKKYLKIFSPVFALSIILSGCGSSSQNNEKLATKSKVNFKVSADNKGEEVSGTTFKYGILTSSPFVGLYHPILHVNKADGVVTQTVFGKTFPVDDALKYKLDDEDAPVKLHIDKNKNEATLTIHEGVKWNNGENLSSKDIIASYELLGNPKYTENVRYNGSFELIEGMKDYHEGRAKTISGITAKDDRTVVIKYSKLSPSLLWGDGFIYSFSNAKQIQKVTDFTRFGEMELTKRPLSYGPYVITKEVQGESVIAEANPHYYKKNDVKIQKIEFKAVSPAQASQILKSGEIDYLTDIDTNVYEGIKDIKNGNILGQPSSFMSFVGFKFGKYDKDKKENIPLANTKFNNKNVRQAFLYAVDRDQINEKIYKGIRFTPTGSALYPPTVGKLKNEKATVVKKDVEKAKKLLDEAGYKDIDGDGLREDSNGEKVVFNFAFQGGNNYDQALADVFIKSWKEVGLDVKLVDNKLMSKKEWDQRVLGDDPEIDLFLGAGHHGSDPSRQELFGRKSRFNYFRYTSDKIEEAFKEQRSDEMFDDNKLKEAYNKFDDLIADKLPFFGLSWDTEITYVNKRVKHFNVEDFTKGYLLIEKLELIKDVPEKE